MVPKGFRPNSARHEFVSIGNDKSLLQPMNGLGFSDPFPVAGLSAER